MVLPDKHLKRHVKSYEKGYSTGLDHGDDMSLKLSNAIGLKQAAQVALKYLKELNQTTENKAIQSQLQHELDKVSHQKLNTDNDANSNKTKHQQNV